MANQGSLPQSSKKTAFFQSGIVIFILAFVLLLYTCLHEGGHAIMGVFFGGTLTDFNANFLNLSAHVGIRGDFSLIQNAAIAAAGVSLPLLVWGFFMVLPGVKANPTLQMVRLVGGLAAINSLVAWIVIPILVMAGQRPADDSTNFLGYTQIYPPIVSGAALLLYTGGMVMLLRHLGGLKGIRVSLDQFAQASFSPASRRTLTIMAILFIAAAAATAILGSQSQENALQLPKGYTQVSMVNLSGEGVQHAVVYRFSIEQDTRVSFFFVLPTLASGPAEILLTGPGNYQNLFFRAPQRFQGGGTVNPTEIPLEAGEYQILMTFPMMNGQVIVGRK